MQNEVTFIIDESGELTFLRTEAAGDILPQATTRRASHVEPANASLRVLFHLLRRWLGDKGRMSEFTRSWPILWRVNMSPVGGPVLGNFDDRQRAIDFEINFLNHWFMR